VRLLGSLKSIVIATFVTLTYMVVVLCLAIVYLITAIRVLKVLRMGRDVGKLKRMTELMLLLVSGIVCVLIGTALCATRLFNRASFSYAATFVYQVGFVLMSCALIAAIPAKPPVEQLSSISETSGYGMTSSRFTETATSYPDTETT
jgi:hypothetical protein